MIDCQLLSQGDKQNMRRLQIHRSTLCRRMAFSLSVSLTFGVVGCGDTGPEIVPITGKITKAGNPVAGASVTFYPLDGRPSYGTSDNQGVYSLEYMMDVPGAVVGTHRVTVMKQGMGPPPAEAAPAPFERPQRTVRRTNDSFEVTLPEPIEVESGATTVDLVVP